MAKGPSAGDKLVAPPIRGYRLTGRLGAGAMGEVYEGVHELIGKRVAVKVLLAGGDDTVANARRLIEEARAVNAVAHPGIVDIFDAGTLPDGRPYLVMERLEGHSLLEEITTRKQLPIREVFHLLAGILAPLDAAHRAGVIHRDLKPSNVFLCDNPTGLPRVKLVDFGIARRAGREEALTHPLMTLGSLGFMGPEHLAGEVVPASDLYSVGCLGYQMATGAPVFSLKNPAKAAEQHINEPAPPLRARRPDAPVELEAWVAWLLEKDPADRPSSADVALAVLKEAEAAATGHGTTPGGPRFGDLARAFDRKSKAQRPPPPPAPPVAKEVPVGKRPTKPVPAKPRESHLMPAFVPSRQKFEEPDPATSRPDASTLFDVDEDLHEDPDKDLPPGERPTVLNWKRPDKP
ncbi:MAG: serine/threonine-protein kinase [Myxococcota bacterium]